MTKKSEWDQPLDGPLVGEDCPPRNLRRFAAVTVIEALTDLNKGSGRRALDALAWLTDPASDFELYLDAADLGNKDIFQVLTSGDARKA